MMNKKIIILILILAVITVVSGCGKKKIEPVVNNNTKPIATTTEPEAPPEEVINYLENGEIDISNWKTYRNELYKFEIKYPEFLRQSEINDKHYFDFDFAKDKNWDINIGGTFPTFLDLTIDEKIKKIGNVDSRNESFKRIEIENGMILYEKSITKRGYGPGALILGKNQILYGSIQIFDENVHSSEHDPKYNKVFIRMLETAKFDK